MTSRSLVVGSILCGLAQAATFSTAATLWSIGTKDANTAEFAFAPKDYQAYRTPGFFIVGVSDPKKDWPYVQPGIIDGGWAPGTPQTFEILFALEAAPAAPCRLELDFADTHAAHPPKLRVEVNDRAQEFQTPAGAGDASVYGAPAQGRPHMITVDVPVGTLKAGANRVAITTLNGSWVLWDAVRFDAPDGAKLAAVRDHTSVRAMAAERQTLAWHDGKPAHRIVVNVTRIGEPAEATLRVGAEKPVTVALRPGAQTVEAFAPPVEKAGTVPVTLTVGAQTVAQADVELQPVRPWVVYVLMHSHVDIGYTHIQPEIARKQAHNVTHALELIEATKDYPEGARFKWNLEVLWPYEQFLAVATPEQKAGFEQAVRDGRIGVDAMYANLLTGLCRGEELVRQFAFAADLGRRCGVTVDSMMISDVPGLTWGVVPALAQSGVKYISDGPNASRSMAGDRIGYVREQWEHAPFYWVSPSGREKALYWGAQGGYSFGHHYPSINAAVPDLLKRLDEVQYPFDIVQLRWSKGDNGPADEGVMPAVRDWNAKYASPQLIVATTSEAFHAFEKRYGDKLPSFRGDFTPYWEDGAPSSSRETGLNRGSADRLSQAETLWALRNPGPFPAADFDAAWKNVAMYSEHTWGAHNSISQPDLEFVRTQWKFKQAYALDADTQSRALLERALGGPRSAANAPAVDVFNTASWPRTDLVTLPKETAGDLVQDDAGVPVPSQRLSSGELVFLARDVPALGAKRFRIAAGSAPRGGAATAAGTTLRSSRFTVKLDEASGAIVSLRQEGLAAELVNGKLNDYVYLPGGNVKDAKSNGPVKITVKEQGPLVASLSVESDAPGCNKLVREVRLVDGLDRVEIIDMVDKQAVRAVEGVHFGFSFNVPEPVVRVNSPGAVGQPEKDQIPGACKNWFSVERWVDVSNPDYGITWSTLDAPLMELGGLTANLPRGQPNPNAYMKHIEPSATLYSWAMNNHWHTNYRADQEGPTWFRYALRPHGAYDPAAAMRFGIESTQPLIATPAAGAVVPEAPFRLEPAGVFVGAFKPSADGKAWIVRLLETTGKDQSVRLVWRQPVRLWESDASELPGRAVSDAIPVPASGLVTLRAMRR